MEEPTAEIREGAAVLQARLRDFEAQCDKVLQQINGVRSLLQIMIRERQDPLSLTGATQRDW